MSTAFITGAGQEPGSDAACSQSVVMGLYGRARAHPGAAELGARVVQIDVLNEEPLVATAVNLAQHDGKPERSAMGSSEATLHASRSDSNVIAAVDTSSAASLTLATGSRVACIRFNAAAPVPQPPLSGKTAAGLSPKAPSPLSALVLMERQILAL